MGEVFQMLDGNNDGSLGVREFCRFFGNTRVRAFLAALGLRDGDPLQLFTLLDVNSRGRLTREEFVHGSEKLRGPSTNMDVKILKYQIQSMEKTLAKVASASEDIKISLSRPRGLVA